MTLQIYTDGGSLNNPGQAAIAYVFYLNGNIFLTDSKRIGVATNNVAEYTALTEALIACKKIIKQHSIKNISVFSDSLLMVNQLNGLYKVKNAVIREMVMGIRILESDLNIPIEYTHILREKNETADSLIKKELKG